MIEIEVRAEVQKLNLADKSCILFLFGIAFENQQEVGRFFIDRKVIENADFEKYVNLAEQTIDPEFIQHLTRDVLLNLDETIKVLVAESNKS